MNDRRTVTSVVLVLALLLASPVIAAPASPGADDPSPPGKTVKLIFIHHSCGENWLDDGNGGLGIALRDNNYFVSDTNYDWGPDNIGSDTDIGHWWTWFRGPRSDTYLNALYTESGQHSYYSRLKNDPGGENQIIMFKSCYPNSELQGKPGDPVPPIDDNPLRGEPSWSDDHTIANAKGIYNDLLTYFKAHQDKLFIAITAPPVSDSTYAANARAFNNWLVKDWLDNYPHNNVAVFDFYNILTSNGGNPDKNDLGEEGGNHHRWWNGAVQHQQEWDQDTAAYPTGDDHPSSAGNQKATAEFVPLLNVFYHRWQETEPWVPDHWVYLPLVLKAWLVPSSPPTDDPPQPIPSQLIEPGDLIYEGVFRLPDGPEEIGWAWSGEALTFYPDGDPDGPADGFPGSLFGTGHNWNQWVSEVSIPVPVDSPSKDVDDLNTATTLQAFHDIRGDLFDHLDFELPRAGLEYLPKQGDQTTDKLHFCWGQHNQETETGVSHGWSELDLSNPQTAGAWRIGGYLNYVTNDYLFAIPQAWAEANTPGKLLATGRFRDGGQGARGPSLLAYGPWNSGNPPAPDSKLPAVPLLLYTDVTAQDTFTLDDYHHSDEWPGGAWLTAGDRSAVVFVGTKGQGECWYGCSDGTVWEPPYPSDCPDHDRGWWSTSFVGQILFYDPADLAAVANGEMETWEPQPYATLDVDEHLYRVESTQQKHHLGAAAFDREWGLLYILEPLADEDKPLVHVWRIED